MGTNWLYGGAGDLFRNLSWTSRPDMAGSEAPQALQDAWVATMLAIRMCLGRIPEGACFVLNIADYPLVQRVLGETVNPCAGYAAFIGERRRMHIGHRWRPDKWSVWVDASESAHLRPLQDVHTWLETETHVIDFSTGDIDGSWPPLAYWPKWRMPKHPRDSISARSTMLLWRNREATDLVIRELAPVVAPIIWLASRILDEETGTKEQAA